MDISITIIIIIFTSLISFQGFNRYELISSLKHFPLLEKKNKEYYRLLTSGFVHADLLHLGINMYVLYSFGQYIEEDYIRLKFGEFSGRIIFLVFYLINIIMANLPTFIKHQNNPIFSSVGASGAVSGIIFIFILLHPWKMIGLFFVLDIPAVILGIIYLIYSSWAANKEQGRIDHSAHFAGAIAGMLMIFILDRQIAGDFIHRLIADFPL